MKTKLLKPVELKAFALGIGLSAGYLAVSILITVYCGSVYQERAVEKSAKSTHQTHRLAR